jgi:hypothetical protein
MAFSQILCRQISSSSVSFAIKNVTVIGGGLMGSGIAQVANLQNKEYLLIFIIFSVLIL